jgi:hypothetical protein
MAVFGSFGAGCRLNVFSGLTMAVLLLAGCLLAACGGGSSASPSGATNPPAALAVTTASLPGGNVGSGYSATLAASGGTTPYSWSIATGTLPAGLSLNSASGAITGTPTAAVSSDQVTVQVRDSSAPAQTKSTSLSIVISAAGALAITTTALPAGQVGVAYSATLAATGGVSPYSWSAISLPAGLSVAASTGLISGTPTTAVTAGSVPVTVTDASNPVMTKSAALAITIARAAPGTLVISTTALPTGLVGTPYFQTLTASGGTTPYHWSLVAGTLPAGLSLASTGAISGTPTATAAATPLTIQIQDSGVPAQHMSVSLTLTVNNPPFTVTVSPSAAGVTVGQALALKATTNDTAGVTWSISPSGGSFSSASSLSGVNDTLTAPATAGVYTITARSVTDTTKTGTASIGVTNLASVSTFHNDLARDGANQQEYALTTANVNTTTFGKLFSCTVDGAIYTQPLWVAHLTINGATHNVVFVATEHDGLYGFDADTNTSPCVPLWHANLIDSNHGAVSGETTVPTGASNFIVGHGTGDIRPEVGVTGTPVIDPVAGILYVVSVSVQSDLSTFHQRLHAIDVQTGNEKTGSPIEIAATALGNGGTASTFTAQEELQRPGLALVNGTVYIAWASYEDTQPYYGWLIGYTYTGSALTQAAVFNVAPDTGQGGIWMSGAAPAADSTGNLYFLTGNAVFDANSLSTPNDDYGDSMLKLSGSLAVLDYFTPSNYVQNNTSDIDFGAGGDPVLVDLPAGSTSSITHLAIGGGKDGNLYVVNRDAMGGEGDSNAVEEFTPVVQSGSGHIFSSGAFWNGMYYVAGVNETLDAYTLDTTDSTFNLATSANMLDGVFGFPGSTPSVSSTAAANGIVWALNTNQYCTGQAHTCGPAILEAFDASNVANELWSSAVVSADAAGFAVKFAVPTIANGKVYVGTRGADNNGFGNTAIPAPSGELDVYGLKP